MISVSVIIVNYNGEKFIKECVDSVLNSDYSSFEIVVVENASTDGSYELLKKNYENNEKVKITRSDQQLYFTGGGNLGASHASGEKLVFLNSDTIVDKKWLRELILFTGEHQKYLVQPKIIFYWQKDTIDNAGGKYAFPGFGFGVGHGEKDTGQYDQNTRTDYANGTVFMIGRKFFGELGGFDEWYKLHYEDVDLNLRAKKQGGESWYCYKSIVYHKGSLTLKSTTPSEILLFYINKNRLRTVIKNFTGWERFLRVSTLMVAYLALAIRDFISFRPKRMSLTVKSTLAAFLY